MNIGKLYQTKELYWFLYPSKEILTAVHAFMAGLVPAGIPYAAADAEGATTATFYYCRKFNCNVSFIEPSSMFMLLEQDGEFIKILSANGEVGWNRIGESYKDYIEEATQKLKSIGYFSV
jgi:hypothetical protein